MSRTPKQPNIDEEFLIGIQLNQRALEADPCHDRPYLRFSAVRSLHNGGTAAQDKIAIPCLDFIKKRRDWNVDDRNSPLGSEKFMKALKGLQQLLIFDYYFDERAMTFLRNCLTPPPHNLSHLFIITGYEFKGTVETAFSEIRQQLAEGNRRPILKAELLCELKRRSPPYHHDRFALLDSEVWHFGATVGGIHEHLNAFSYGWHNRDVKFSDFFKAAWDHLTSQTTRISTS